MRFLWVMVTVPVLDEYTLAPLKVRLNCSVRLIARIASSTFTIVTKSLSSGRGIRSGMKDGGAYFRDILLRIVFLKHLDLLNLSSCTTAFSPPPKDTIHKERSSRLDPFPLIIHHVCTYCYKPIHTDINQPPASRLPLFMENRSQKLSSPTNAFAFGLLRPDCTLSRTRRPHIYIRHLCGLTATM